MRTAVEWLIDELRNKHGLSIDLYSEFEQAKEMEKEQISKAYFEGWSCPHGEGLPETGEQYYNETFKK
jgi:hypothetical protein